MNICESWIVKQPIAHRGLHNEEFPELSLGSFKNAIDNGYAIEIDVRPLADGTIVVFHDDKLGRMTGADGYISQMKYEDIKDLHLAKTNERIPTLEETLKYVDGRTPLLIEIKNMNKVGFEKNVWKLLSRYKGEYAVQSFNPYSLEWFKLNAPFVKRGQLASFFKNEDLNPIKKYALKRMLLNKKISEPHFIGYKTEDMPNRFVKKFSDLPVLAWVVRDDEEYDRIKNHVDNIIFENITPNK